MQNKKNFFCGFEPAKMHCEFAYTANAFQDESWDLSNFICSEGSRNLNKIPHFYYCFPYYKFSILQFA